MKLIAILICIVGLTGSYASVFGQQAKLNLNVKNTTIKDVLKIIEGQCDYSFMYNASKIDIYRKVDLKLENSSLEEILDKIFAGEAVSYKAIDNFIIISSKSDMSEVESGQQKRPLSGSVTDPSKNPLPGVSVVIKGTTLGTITNADGHYSLPNVPSDATLLFSFVGMKAQEIKVSDKSIIDVIMTEETVGIEEVVAIGYGTVKKRDITGSMSSVTGNALKDIPVTSAAQAIVGRMAGVQVTKTEGAPDAEIKIRIRGGGSITQDNSPLYIVDGFPVSTINDIAPTDIASIDVLKDASSTAIYGARGANGVILITTKSGHEGKATVSYNMYYGVKNITKTLDVLNPYEYVFWQYEYQATDATSSFEKYFGDFQDMQLYKQVKGIDWQDKVLGRTGTSMYHNVTVSGGSKVSKYNISLTRNDEKEVMEGSGYARTNFTVKTSHKVKDWLTIELNSRLSDYKLKGAGTSSNTRLSHIVQFRPVNGLMDFVDSGLTDAGDYEASSSFVLDPLKQTNDDYRRLNTLTFNFNGAALVQILKDLSYRFEYGIQYTENTNNRFYGLNTSEALTYGTQPLASIAKVDGKSFRVANILTYTKNDFLPGSNITVMAGEELNSMKSISVTTSAKYFPTYIDATSALSMMQLGIADPTIVYDSPDNKTSSFFGRVNYDYKGKYLASVTFRADGSSKFAPGNQWGYFPSAALAWRISDENFMKSTEQWLSSLKLRASYGESGNNRIGDDVWKKVFSVATGTLYKEGNETSPTSFFVPGGSLSNTDLKWETTITRNLGTDFSFFKGRINGSVEIYKNTTKDLLISATIPSSTGYSSQLQNVGQTSNKGLEIMIEGVIVDKNDFRLSASFNIGFNRNKIDRLGDTKKWEQSSSWTGDGPSGDYLIEEGGKVGLIYGYETEGMYSFDDFNYDASTQKYTLKDGVSDNSSLINAHFFRPGALKLKNQDDNLAVTADDKVVIGDTNPKHTGGFNLSAQYKGFDFSAFFNWVYGNDIYNANKLNFTSCIGARPYKNLLDIMNSGSRFTYVSQVTGEIVNDPNELAEMNKDATIWSPGMIRAPLHSWVVEDGSFLRLNNLTLGYSIPKKVLDILKIEQLRIYATAYNLWTWTNYSGFDPEVDCMRSTPLTPGIDWNAYPRSRSFNFGINLTF